MDLKSWKSTVKNWLNEVKPRLSCVFPHALNPVPKMNELGELIRDESPMYDPLLPYEQDDNRVKYPYLSLDSNNPAEFAAAAAVIDATSDVKTNGLSPVGEDDAAAATNLFR